jgi:UDP-N-acetylmuramoylalanine--D-glutamate ligase
MSEIKSFVQTLEGRPVLVYGLGKSGSALVRALCEAGASLIVGDDNPSNLEQFAGYENIDILDMDKLDFSVPACLALAPGIPLTHPKPHDIVVKAQKAGLEILCDIELFFRIHSDLKTVAVTGTNGKSTLVSLLSHVLTKACVKNALGGNIGTAVFDLAVEGDNHPDWVVLEMSSYQIDLCPKFRPDIALVINITPDHIDRHGSVEHYAAVKERLLDKSGTAIICSDDTYTREMLARAKANNMREIIEVSYRDAQDTKALKGAHNQQNIACVNAIAKKIGLNPDETRSAIESFPGLNHRQYLVRTMGGVDYINDSKATNPASSAMALCCCDNIYWIVGGRRKETGLGGLEEFSDRIKHVFLIGESTDEFSVWFEKYNIKHSVCYTMQSAVDRAHIMAQSGGTGVVLLSPACASFDQYQSFEKRGEHFAALVQALKDEV